METWEYEIMLNNLQKALSTELGRPVSEEELVTLIKGKTAQIGEIRTWNGVKMRKVAPDKWEPVKESGQKPAQESKIPSNTSRLTGQDWVLLLRRYPEEAAKEAEWDKLTGDDWANLLKERPQFIDKCDRQKLNGYDWEEILVNQPQLAKYCDFRKLTLRNWDTLVEKRPEFKSRLPERYRKTLEKLARNMRH